MLKIFNHTYILSTIFFTVYSQLVMRWQVSLAGELPSDMRGIFLFVGNLLINPWVFSALVSTFLAGVSWMLAMTKFEISYAFPFVSLNYIFILFASYLFFGEMLSLGKVIGTLFVVVGIVIVAKG